MRVNTGCCYQGKVEYVDLLCGGVFVCRCDCFFFFKQKTAYEIKECDWSSDVCSSDLLQGENHVAWMKTSGELKKILSGIVSAESIKPVRKEFAPLSEKMAAAVKRFGIAGDSLYQFKCPMEIGRAHV